MATRRRGVKHSYNKTRTTSKASLRKTRHKNKKSKHRKTKKRYQSGGGPKARSKGAPGLQAEPKTIRYHIRRGLMRPQAEEDYFNFNKLHPTAEFDIPIEVSGLSYNISVKSIKQKTPGQNVFPILCGDARRFLSQVGLGKEGYHMVIAVRKKHPTKPNKRQIAASEIDLREAKGLIFGNITDDEIKQIVERVNQITTAYYRDSTAGKVEIDAFNEYLKRIGSKMRLVPRIENPEKRRPPRVQTSFNFNPESPRTKELLTTYSLSSQESQENTPEEMETGDSASRKSVKPPVSRGVSNRSRGVSNRSRGVSNRSRGVSNRSRGVSSSGISKQPTPEVSYFRKFTPRVRGKTPLEVIPEEPTP